MTANTKPKAADDVLVEEEIIRCAKLSYERLPMMEVIFERFTLALAAAIKSYVGAITDVTLEKFEYMSCGEALDDLVNPTLIAVVSPVPWEGEIALIMDPDLLFSALEITLGGRTSVQKAWTPRSFTSIEKRLGNKLFEISLEELATALEQLFEVKFPISHTETNPKSLVLAPPIAPVVKVTLRMTFDDRGGTITFVMPNSAFESVRPLLAQSFMGGQLGGNSGWRTSLSHAIEDTHVVVDAVLREQAVPLNDVLAWVPGAVIDLNIDANDEVTVYCEGKPMLRAAMGRRKNASIALRVTEVLLKTEEKPNVLSD